MHLEPFSSLVFKHAIDRICFGDLYLWCEGRFLPHAELTYAPSIKRKLASLNRDSVLNCIGVLSFFEDVFKDGQAETGSGAKTTLTDFLVFQFCTGFCWLML